VNSVGEVNWLVKRESGVQQSSLEKKPDKVLNGLVTSVLIKLSLKLINNSIVRIDFHGLLGHHVRSLVGILKRLSFHDSLHISGPSPLRSDQNTRRRSKSESENAFLDLISQNFFDLLTKRLESGFLFFLQFLLFLSFFESQSFFSTISEFLSVVLLELLDYIFVDWIGHVDNFKVSLKKSFKERRFLDRLDALSGDVVDFLLGLSHSFSVFLQGNKLIV